jgi:hypothetical protein
MKEQLLIEAFVLDQFLKFLYGEYQVSIWNIDICIPP